MYVAGGHSSERLRFESFQVATALYVFGVLRAKLDRIDFVIGKERPTLRKCR